MPPVVVAVAVGAAAYVAGATVIAAITIAAVAASLYMVATMDIPSTPGTDPINAKKTIRTPNQPCRRIFGTAMVGGILSFAEEYLHKSGYNETYTHCTTWNSGGERDRHCEERTRWVDTSKKWLHLVVVLAAHEIEDVTEVYFGDEKITVWDHDYWKINVVKGDQTSIDDLPQLLRDVPSWTNTMIGKGVAFLHVALRHSTKHFPNGIPNIRGLVKGTKLDTPFFSGFGNNTAACIYHFLRHHFGASEKMINTQSFSEEFLLCNEVMTDEITAFGPGSGITPIRYACDGAFDYDETHANVLKKMLSTCGGSLIFTNGQYYLQVAAYRGPVSSKQVITLDNLNGPLNISPDTPLNERINTVKGQYLDPLGYYLQTDFEPVTSQTYIDEDGGEERSYDANFEFVQNVHQAHRLANIILKDNRYGLTVRVPMNLSGFKFNAGLLVGLDEKTLGYDDLEFRVTNWKLDPKGGVVLTLKQTSADIYDDSIVTVSPKPKDPDLPNPKFCHPVENLTFDDFADDGVYDGLLWWTHPDLQNVRDFEVSVTSTSGEIFKFNTGKDTEIRLRDMLGTQYTISVIAYNVYGAPSTPVEIVSSIGAPKPLIGVTFEPSNFEIKIIPKVSGSLPQNTRFAFFRANSPVPSSDDITSIGEGVTYTDTGRIPNTAYHYYIQPINNSSAGQMYGPYATKTTDNPEDIYDLIEDKIPGQYTWVVYASDAFGADINFVFNPAIHKFEGRAYNKSEEIPSLNPLDYTFFRIADFISDEDQAILDNLAAGKMPDGSADLVKPDDILFKPGDFVETVNIADDAISSPKIKANAIVADKIAANAVTTAKLDAGAVTATKIAAQSVTASKILAGAVTASKIAAQAVTADKIAVTVVSPVNNYSEFGDLRGWTIPTGSVLDESVMLEGKPAKTLKTTSSSVTKIIRSDKFSIDHNAIYEVRFSIYCDQTTSAVGNRFGVVSYNSAGSGLRTKLHHPVTLDYVKEVINAYLWEGYVVSGWRHMVAYVVGANADINACPKSKNVSYIAKLTSDIRSVSVLTEVVGSGNVRDVHYYSPSVIKVGSGLIVANEIRAGSKITAPTIEGGVVNGTQINGAKIDGGVITGVETYGSKLITESGNIFVMSDYNKEVYGTMDYGDIVSAGNTPYLCDYILPYRVASSGLYGRPPVTMEYTKDLLEFSNQNPTNTVIENEAILTIRPYDDQNSSLTNRLSYDGEFSPGSFEANARIYLRGLLRVPSHLVSDVTVGGSGKLVKNIGFRIKLEPTSNNPNMAGKYTLTTASGFTDDNQVANGDVVTLGDKYYILGSNHFFVFEREVPCYYSKGIKITFIPYITSSSDTTVFSNCFAATWLGVSQPLQNT